MKFLDGYLEYVSALPRIIAEREMTAILSAAKKMADVTIRGGLIHVIGTGAHSHIGTSEFFARQGSLMNINPIFDPAISLDHGASRCWMIERLPGYILPILNYYYVQKDEVMIIINPYGINCATIDTALWAKEKGLCVVAVTSSSFSHAVSDTAASRHPSGKNLCDMEEVDVVIDMCLPDGDANVHIDGFGHSCAPVSTVSLSVILSMLNAQAVRILIEAGHVPDVIANPYTYSDAESHNVNMVNKYYERIKHL